MGFGNIDVINSWKYLNFINSENTSVMVAAMKRLHASTYQVFGLLKFRFQVDCLEHGNESKTMTNVRTYHVKETNLMRRVSWL